MSLDDMASALKLLGTDKKTMAQALYDNFDDLDGIEKALDGITDKGGILNSLFASLSNGAKSFGTALKGFLLSPAAKIVGVMLAIAAAVKLLDLAIVTPKEATEAMTESFGEFENAQNEVEALNSELEQTKDKIAALQAKGNLSLIEKEELRNLREAEKSLEMQKELSEELMSAKAAKAAQSAAVAYTKNFRKEISQAATDEYLNQIASGENALLIGNLLTDKSNVSSMIAGLQRITELRNKSTDKETWDSYNETVQDTTTSIWEQADALMEQKTILEDSKKAIEDNGGRLTDYQQSALDNINSSLDYIYKEMSPETWKQMKIDEIFNKDQFSYTKQGLTELAKEYDNLTDFTNAAIRSYGDLNDALIKNGVTMADIAENIFAEAGIIDTESVRKQLKDTFADTTGMGAWAEQVKGEFNNWANSLSKEDLELVYKIMLDTDEANFDLETWKNTLEEYKAMQALDHGVDISIEKEGLDKVTTAISENASEVGLLDESINSLKSRYKALKDFDADKLFEQTANGIRLNTDELAQLESKYTAENITKLNDALEVAADRYKEAAILAKANTDPEFAKSYEIRAENALDEVKAIQQLITQYNALNGAYAKAMKAASTPNGGAMRDNVKSLWDNAKQLRQAGKVGTDDFQSFVELITGKDYFNGENATGLEGMVSDFDKINNQIKIMKDGVQKGTLSQSIGSLFAEGIVGANNFINAIKQAGKLYDGSEWVTQEGNNLQFEVDTASLSEALGISEELVFILMENLKDFGFNIDIEQGTDSFEELTKEAEELYETVKNVPNVPPINLDINSQNIKDEIDKVKQWLNNLNKESESYGASKEYGKTLLKSYYAKEQELSGQRYDISSVDEGGKAIAAKWNEAQDALAEYNATIDAYGEGTQEAQDAQQKLNDAANSFNDTAKNNNIDFQLDTNDIEKVKEQLNDISSLDKIDLPLKGESAQRELDSLKIVIDEIRNTPVVLPLDITDALAKVSELAAAIKGLNQPVTIKPDDGGGDGDGVDKNGETEGGTITYNSEVEPPVLEPTNGIINWINNVSIPSGLVAYGTIIWSSAGGGGGNFSFTAPGGKPGSLFATGTAYSRGNWGIGNNGTALGGELGQELVVRDGKFFTIGDRGAEFFKYKKNDIVFNAAQTESLFKYGGIKGANPRGKVYGSGSAFSSGTIASGSISDKLWQSLLNGTISSDSNSNGTSSSSDDSETGYDTDNDFFDWIEILIDRIERAIDHFEKKVDNIFDSWENRGNALNSQTDVIRKEIEAQQKAYDYYLEYIKGIGLEEKYAERIHNGTMKVTLDYDDELKAQIEDYQEFYEKALDCKAAVDDLTISLSECYQTAFDNVITRYDQLVAITEHSQAMLDASISQAEAKGYFVSQKYYEMQIANEKELIEQQKEKREELIKTRDTALMDGVVVEGSEAWLNMNAEIDACTEAIAESNTAIIEFNNSIQEVNWEIFDFIQDRISNVSDEAEFLIDLLSNDKLFDDKGQLTSEGLVSLGLYGQRYNSYLAQAAMYADELVKINNQIKDDSNNKTLIERRQELLELQHDSILAAEDEKKAIVDLISDGFDAQLNSLEELINKYNEALDAQKDLYDYQKNITEQAKNIAQLEKQLAIYQGSDSEEIQAKVQQIKVSLDEAKSNFEETQYDKFIDDQQKLLDELYTGYEDLLNERLDNTDALVEEMIEKINLNAEEINQTLAKKADSVGYTLSQDMQNIWNGESGTNNILTTYGEGILNATTTVVTTLNTINSNLMNMVNQLNNLADMDISAIPVTGAYKDGKKKVVNDENAWTQEDATEYIVRPSDGAILTPVAQDDSILDSYASGNIWKMANNPSEFIRENLKTGIVAAPVNGNKNTTVTQNFEKIIFDMPNVTSYSEMLESMKRDKNFKRLVLAFTTDQLAGKSSMRVSKSF